MAKETKLPKYKVIVNDIEDKISSGYFSTDKPLPTENELSNIYNCSRVTIRAALDDLVFKGIIYKVQGSGSYVSEQGFIQRSPLIKSFTKDMLEINKTPSSIIKEFRMAEAGKYYSSILGIPSNESIYIIERIRCADGVPAMVERTYASAKLHSYLSIDILQKSKYQAAEERGLRVSYAEQNISPIMPSAEMADNLHISLYQPILKVTNKTFMENGQIFDYVEMYMNTDVYKFVITKRNNF